MDTRYHNHYKESLISPTGDRMRLGEEFKQNVSMEFDEADIGGSQAARASLIY